MTATMPHNLLSQFCPPVILTALDAGDEIMKIYRGEDFQVEYKEDKSPLTLADKAANDLIMKRLQMLWDLPVISEESQSIPQDVRAKWTNYWLVDPLDGTKEFIKRNGEFTVNIALIENGEPIFGVVYAPALETLYFGAHRCGARKAVRGIDFTSREDLVAKLTDTDHNFTALPLPYDPERPFTVVASRSHCNVETTDFIERLEVERGPATRVSIGSSLKLCLVAEGTADVYPRIAPTMHWDTAAAHAVVIAAGGDVVDFNTNEPLTYQSSTLANPFFVAYSRDFT